MATKTQLHLPTVGYQTIESKIPDFSAVKTNISSYNIPSSNLYNSNSNNIDNSLEANNTIIENSSSPNLNYNNQTISTSSNLSNNFTPTNSSPLSQKVELMLKDNVNIDKVSPQLKGILEEYYKKGVKFRITEGFASSGHAKNSWHYKGEAVDITPIDKKDYAGLIRGFQSHPDLIDRFKQAGYRLFDERKNITTNWAGSHFHIGKDTKVPITNWDTVKGQKGIKLLNPLQSDNTRVNTSKLQPINNLITPQPKSEEWRKSDPYEQWKTTRELQARQKAQGPTNVGEFMEDFSQLPLHYMSNPFKIVGDLTYGLTGNKDMASKLPNSFEERDQRRVDNFIRGSQLGVTGQIKRNLDAGSSHTVGAQLNVLTGGAMNSIANRLATKGLSNASKAFVSQPGVLNNTPTKVLPSNNTNFDSKEQLTNELSLVTTGSRSGKPKIQIQNNSGDAVATLKLSNNINNPTNKALNIESVNVLPEYQGRDFTKLLYNSGINLSKNLGLDGIKSGTNVSNSAFVNRIQQSFNNTNGILTSPINPNLTSDITRSTRALNRVFEGGSPMPSKNPNAFIANDPNRVYRLTGQGQIDDMISSGRVRPREGKIKGGHTDEVHWSRGADNLRYAPQEGQYIISPKQALNNNTQGALKTSNIDIWRNTNGKWEPINNTNKDLSRFINKLRGNPEPLNGNALIDQIKQEAYQPKNIQRIKNFYSEDIQSEMFNGASLNGLINNMQGRTVKPFINKTNSEFTNLAKDAVDRSTFGQYTSESLPQSLIRPTSKQGLIDINRNLPNKELSGTISHELRHQMSNGVQDAWATPPNVKLSTADQNDVMYKRILESAGLRRESQVKEFLDSNAKIISKDPERWEYLSGGDELFARFRGAKKVLNTKGKLKDVNDDITPQQFDQLFKTRQFKEYKPLIKDKKGFLDYMNKYGYGLAAPLLLKGLDNTNNK